VSDRDARTHPMVRGFDREARRYERARPGYPRASVRHLAKVLDLRRGRTIVELGSGTGKFTRAILPTGAAVVAIEPTPGMRREFRRAVPEVALLPGTAEAIPLPDGFADAVVAAQAFHWFRSRPALREIARVLRPRGGLGLVWNTGDESFAVWRRIREVVERYRSGSPRSREHAWRAPFDRGTVPFDRLRERRFRHAPVVRPEGLVERTLSVSVVAMLPPAERRAVAREIRAILASDPATRGRASFRLPYWTEVYWTRRS